MSKEEFIDWIKSLGFSRTWQSIPDEYSIYPKASESVKSTGLNNHPLSGPKVYFTIDYDEIRIYYSNFSNNMSFGSNIGRFPLSSIGDYERLLIVNKLSEYFTELPNGFKEFLRDAKLKNILRD